LTALFLQSIFSGPASPGDGALICAPIFFGRINPYEQLLTLLIGNVSAVFGDAPPELDVLSRQATIAETLAGSGRQLTLDPVIR
jgi:hypothetical protein